MAVLVVDDSAVARAAITHALADHAGLKIVGVASGAAQAIAWLASARVDVVLLDIEMPGRDGLAALPDLLAAGRGAQVLIVSSTARDGAAATMRGLALGASDTIAKPAVGGIGDRFGMLLAERIVRLGRARSQGSTHASFTLRPSAFGPIAVVGIAASTGGIGALTALIAQLPPTFAAPVFVTQHLPTAFVPYLVDQLGALSARRVTMAVDGGAVAAGDLIVARGDAHLIVERGIAGFTTRLSTAPAPTRNCPAADPMFASLADAAGCQAVAVVLSGMGRDGSIGAAAIVQAGGSTIVQDAATSAVWGMPGAVAHAGLASLVAGPAQLGDYLARRGG